MIIFFVISSWNQVSVSGSSGFLGILEVLGNFPGDASTFQLGALIIFMSSQVLPRGREVLGWDETRSGPEFGL